MDRDQQNRPELNPCIHCQLIFANGARNTQWEIIASLTNDDGEMDKHMQNSEIGLLSYTTQKN